jgi:ABC-2 type transport system ATP-binding protein
VTALIEQLSHQAHHTVFLCTHNLAEAQRLCDRVAVLREGRILALGTPAELARTLWHSHWLDIELRQAPDPQLGHVLRQIPGVVEVHTDGCMLAVQMREEALIPTIVAEVAAGGGLIMRVNPQEHSLEEVYFALQRREAGSSAPDKELIGQVKPPAAQEVRG